MIKIIIADDHSIVREGLKQIISATPNMMVSGEAGNGKELIQKIRKEKHDIVVLDIKMPGTNVIETIRALKELRPEVPILILSMYPEDQYAIRVLKAGAAGYLNKESAPRELVAAIQKIAGGGRFISENVSDQLVFQLGDDSDVPAHQKLSDREDQVFRLIASGKTVKAIAEELNLSEKTVSTYRGRILQKLNLKTNAQMTHYAFKYGLVDI